MAADRVLSQGVISVEGLVGSNDEHLVIDAYSNS